MLRDVPSHEPPECTDWSERVLKDSDSLVAGMNAMGAPKTDLIPRSIAVFDRVWGRPASSASTTWGRRAAALIASWVMVGLAVGYLGRESAGAGIIGTVSNMIAGAIVLPVVGLPMLILGARGRETILGGSLGAIFATLSTFFTPSCASAQFMSLAVVMGALFATTGAPFVRLLIRGAVWRRS